MGRKSRTKGRGGEYEVRDLLTNLFYKDGSGEFVRTPLSGAWGHTKIMTGDLVPIRNDKLDESIPFFWEVKRVDSDISVAQLIQGFMPNRMRGWLDKAHQICSGSSYIPLIIWRMNFMGWMVVMSLSSFYIQTELFGKQPFGCILKSNVGFEDNGVVGWVCMSFDTWSYWISESNLIESVSSEGKCQ